MGVKRARAWGKEQVAVATASALYRLMARQPSSDAEPSFRPVSQSAPVRRTGKQSIRCSRAVACALVNTVLVTHLWPASPRLWKSSASNGPGSEASTRYHLLLISN